MNVIMKDDLVELVVHLNCNCVVTTTPRQLRACQVCSPIHPNPSPRDSLIAGTSCAEGVKGQVGGSIPTGNNPPAMRESRGEGLGCIGLHT